MAIKSFIETGAIWDGDTYSLKYFGVSRNFTQLKKGKNTITLSPSEAIVPGSEIDVEIVDRNGNQIKVEYPNQITANGDNILHVTITEETPTGAAKFYIRGTSFYDADTGIKLNTSYKNIIWRGLTEIKTAEDDETPQDPDDIVFNGDKKDISVNVQSKCLPYKDKAGTDRPTEYTGTGTLTYNSITTSSTFSNNIANKPTTRSSTSSRPISNVNNSNSSTTNIGNPTSNSDGFPTIVSSQAEFTADMVGSVITIQPNINNFASPSVIAQSASPPNYTATVVEVVNSTTIRVDTPFTFYDSNTGLFVDQFTSTSYTINYNKSVNLSDGQKVTCYAQLCFDNVSTSNGQVDKVRVSVKPVGAVGNPTLLGDFDVQVPNKMQDTGSFTMDPRTGVQYKSAGDVSSSADITNYYDYASYSVSTTPTAEVNDVIYQQLGSTPPSPTHRDDKLMHSLSTSSPTNDNEVTAISIKDQYVGSAKAGTEYKITLNAYSEKDGTGKTPKAYVYISGPAVEEFTQTSNTFGTLIETIEGGDGETQSGLEYTFTAASDSDKVKLYLVLDVGTWDFSNIKVEPSSKTGNTPNEFCTLVPLDSLPVNKINEEYVFVVDFIAKNGKPTNINLTTQSITLNGDVTIDESLIINTFNSSTLIQEAISGSSIWYVSEGGDETDIKTENTFSFIEGGAIDMSLNVGGKSLTICHEDTSNQTSFVSNGSSYIKTICLDTYGHITCIETEFTSSIGDSELGGGSPADDYVNGASFNTGSGELTLSRICGGTVVVDLDGRYSTSDANTITTVGTSSLGNSGTIKLLGSGSIELFEQTTDSGSLITIFSDANPVNISGSLISGSFDGGTSTIELFRQSTSSVFVPISIDSYSNWVVSDGTISSNINDGDTLTIIGSGSITSSLSGCTLTLSTPAPTLCTVTTAGDCTGVLSCFVATTDTSDDGGLCAKGRIHLTSYCKSGKCDMVLETLLGSIYLCSTAGIGIGTNCFYSKAGSITLNQLACSQGVRVFNLPSNPEPTHIVSICNPTSTGYTADGCQATLEYTAIDDLSARLGSSLSGSLSTSPGTLDTTTTNSTGSGLHYHEITTTETDTASTIVQTNSSGEITAANFITTSDKRLKEDIVSIKSGLDVINKFSSYTYLKKGVEDAGFIAQEVCTVLPKSVQKDSNGFLTIKESHILAYMHKAIIELSDKISCIETKLNS